MFYKLPFAISFSIFILYIYIYIYIRLTLHRESNVIAKVTIMTYSTNDINILPVTQMKINLFNLRKTSIRHLYETCLDASVVHAAGTGQ